MFHRRFIGMIMPDGLSWPSNIWLRMVCDFKVHSVVGSIEANGNISLVGVIFDINRIWRMRIIWQAVVITVPF